MPRWSLLGLVGCGFISVAALLAFAPSISGAATAGVSIQDDAALGGVFSPKTTTITAGDSVLWTWTGADRHSVTADDASFDEPPADAKTSGTFSHTFNAPGTYAYYCRVHGALGGAGMSGTIVVQAAPATNTPAPTNTVAPDTATPAPPGTPAATNTPGSATPATTPTTATGTPLASVTAPVATSTVAGTTPIATATRSGGAARGAQLPRTGSGSTISGSMPGLSIVLTAAGLGLLAGAFTMTRRS